MAKLEAKERMAQSTPATHAQTRSMMRWKTSEGPPIKSTEYRLLKETFNGRKIQHRAPRRGQCRCEDQIQTSPQQRHCQRRQRDSHRSLANEDGNVSASFRQRLPARQAASW